MDFGLIKRILTRFLVSLAFVISVRLVDVSSVSQFVLTLLYCMFSNIWHGLFVGSCFPRGLRRNIPHTPSRQRFGCRCISSSSMVPAVLNVRIICLRPTNGQAKPLRMDRSEHTKHPHIPPELGIYGVVALVLGAPHPFLTLTMR